jgi:hypothetical protein
MCSLQCHKPFHGTPAVMLEYCMYVCIGEHVCCSHCRGVCCCSRTVGCAHSSTTEHQSVTYHAAACLGRQLGVGIGVVGPRRARAYMHRRPDPVFSCTECMPAYRLWLFGCPGLVHSRQAGVANKSIVLLRRVQLMHSGVVDGCGCGLVWCGDVVIKSVC